MEERKTELEENDGQDRKYSRKGSRRGRKS